MEGNHLWEVEHPYYCSESNFFSKLWPEELRSWQEFMESYGVSDPDLDLVFRWDWKAPKEGDVIKWHGDENYRDSRLLIFIVRQRQGIFKCVAVDVCRADEPAVKEWLISRYNHLLTLWTPISDKGK